MVLILPVRKTILAFLFLSFSFSFCIIFVEMIISDISFRNCASFLNCHRFFQLCHLYLLLFYNCSWKEYEHYKINNKIEDIKKKNCLYSISLSYSIYYYACLWHQWKRVQPPLYPDWIYYHLALVRLFWCWWFF